MSQNLADVIASEACKLFNQLPKKGKPTEKEWTTMAAIVQETFLNKDQAQCDHGAMKVVSLGTGTKCLGSTELSKFGDVVSDSHAEVIARRSFLLYLYENIELFRLGKGENSIFKLKNYDNTVDEKECKLLGNLEIRDGIKFHMFISHAPCGDAAIIDKSEQEQILSSNNQDSSVDDQTPAKKPKIENVSPSHSLQENRTGAKLQFGPLQYEEKQRTGVCRVKPGKGDPTLCMSCSDKLGKWLMLGLQGSLLSNFIPEPITLKSVIIGGNVPFDKNSVERGLFQRFSEKIKNLKESGQIQILESQCPIVEQSQHNFISFTEHLVPAPASISWYFSKKRSDSLGKESVQVLVSGRRQGATKKSFQKLPSMVEICRARLLSRFVELYCSGEDNDDSKNRITYEEAKQISKNYLCQWNILKKEVFLGWTDKPDGLKSFVAFK